MKPTTTFPATKLTLLGVDVFRTLSVDCFGRQSWSFTFDFGKKFAERTDYVHFVKNWRENEKVMARNLRMLKTEIAQFQKDKKSASGRQWQQRSSQLDAQAIYAMRVAGKMWMKSVGWNALPVKIYDVSAVQEPVLA